MIGATVRGWLGCCHAKQAAAAQMLRRSALLQGAGGITARQGKTIAQLVCPPLPAPCARRLQSIGSLHFGGQYDW